MNKIQEKNEIKNHFINQDNYLEISKHITDVLVQTMEVLVLNDKAIINSYKNDTNNEGDNFALEKFPKRPSYKDELEMIINQAKVPNFWSGKFLGQMHPSRNTTSLVSWLVSSLLNQNLIAEEVSPAFTKMENQVIGYLWDLIWYDLEKSWGSIVSWGTTANHTSMIVARNLLLLNEYEWIDENWVPYNITEWVDENWIANSLSRYNELNKTKYKDLVVYVWEDNHYSIDKLVSYVWIWSKNVKRIPYKKWTYELDLDKFKKMINDSEDNNELIMWVFITWWTTEKWHVHDINWIINITKWKWQNGREIYTHVDAAHWWWFLVNDKLKETTFKWINEADSVTIDGHKMLYTNYSCGWIIFKDKNSLKVIKHSAEYIMPEKSLNENHGMYTIEWSRGTSWVHQLWSSINNLWKEGYQKLIKHSLDNTKYLYEKLEYNDNFEILSWEPTLNLICFRYNPKDLNFKSNELNALNNSLRDNLLSKWEYYIWDTTIDKNYCFKAVLLNPETTKENIDWFLNEIVNISKLW